MKRNSRFLVFQFIALDEVQWMNEKILAFIINLDIKDDAKISLKTIWTHLILVLMEAKAEALENKLKMFLGWFQL